MRISKIFLITAGIVFLIGIGLTIYVRYETPNKSTKATFTTAQGRTDLIELTNPLPGQTISSPLTVTGRARGNWYFEASFPVMLTNWDGLIIAQAPAQAEGEWMTEEFVPFSVTLTFDENQLYERGSLILKKDNPSDLPEHDDALEIPVLLKTKK
ncbi:MAG: Gmad2 immunoglobulin-like domain-containing protein [Candidatus Paceibacterota bacterium]